MSDCLDDTLACVREAIVYMMKDTAIVHSYSRVNDGLGGGSVVFQPSGTVACMVSVAGKPNETLFGNQIISEALFVITLPHDTIVKPYDKIEVDNRLYEVVGSNVGQTNLVCVHASCRKLEK